MAIKVALFALETTARKNHRILYIHNGSVRPMRAGRHGPAELRPIE